jgi:radical SAM superfamily enzyme YgiQ (UPF0313 family)
MSRELVEKAQQLLACEKGTVRKPLEGRIRFALAFPSTYKIGAASLGYQIIYRMINDIHYAVCERVFLPDKTDIEEYNRTKTRLFTLESQTPAAEFDVIAFSISYELDYINIAKMLKLAGLPTAATKRDESHPLVIAGGACATFNPEPLADICDAFAIGDGEELIRDIASVLIENREIDRQSVLKTLAHVPGIYVPRFYEPIYDQTGAFCEINAIGDVPKTVRKRITKNLDSYPADGEIVSSKSEFAGMKLVEIMRGCGRHCRFCVSGCIGLPPRARKWDQPPASARIGLIGASVLDHPNARDILESMSRAGIEFSLSSIRLETLTPDIAQYMHKAGQRTITLAPEAGSYRLRKVINKPATDDEIIHAVGVAYEAGFKRVKLYFMIGLPTETNEDAAAIAQLVSKLAGLYKKLAINVSISSFVPKPWTPFQWYAMTSRETLKHRIDIIRSRLAGTNRVSISAESPREAYEQALLARGDRRLGEVIIYAADNDTSCTNAAAKLGVDTNNYVRSRALDEALPWEHIDPLVTKDYLIEEYKKALNEIPTDACVVEVCRRCGVCGEVYEPDLD